MDMTIHDFDMVRYLSGGEVTGCTPPARRWSIRGFETWGYRQRPDYAAV
ncbi:MAG: hypothetical protein ACLSA6_18740 [Holdemania massiliensis]